MSWKLRALTAGILLLFGSFIGETAVAEKTGGVLRIYHWDSPASMSIHEEATYSTVVPMMGVFNNLVIYKQDEPKNSLNRLSQISRRGGRGARMECT